MLKSELDVAGAERTMSKNRAFYDNRTKQEQKESGFNGFFKLVICRHHWGVNSEDMGPKRTTLVTRRSHLSHTHFDKTP
jgi:hypothetical protein